jgi:hypothetical protein
MIAGLDTKKVLGGALVIILIIVLVKGVKQHDSGSSGSSTSTVSTTKVVTTNPNPNRYAYHPAANPYKNKYY